VSDERPLSTGEVARLLHVTPVAVLGWIGPASFRLPRSEEAGTGFLAPNSESSSPTIRSL